MASPTPQTSAGAAGGSTNDPEADAIDDDRPRLKLQLRLADIIQLNIIIGRSRFGVVKLAKNRQTDEIYALKALLKSRSELR
jgi:hypothetical protein